MTSPEFYLGLAAGLGAAVTLYLVLWWQARRTAKAEPPPLGALGRSNGPVHRSDDLEAARPRSAPDSSAPASSVSSPVPEAPTVAGPPPPVATAGIMDRPIGALPASLRGGPPTETLRLSQRVILHVYVQGNLPPGEVAPPELCQAGIVAALGIPQAGLAAVLRRLEAAGILVTERGHVRGHDRRLKIYRLSTRGVEVAKELRSRRRPAR